MSTTGSERRAARVAAVAMMALVMAVGCRSQSDQTTSSSSSATSASMDTIPTCSSARDLAQFDGQQVQLVGVYRKIFEEKKKGGEPAFLGYAGVEVEGHPREYDPQAWDGARAIVTIGDEPRPEGEADTLEGKRVRVTGKLVVRPPSDDSIAQPDPEPTLMDPGPVQAASD
ncbi:hypothetical protein [Haliangium sp.]